MSRPERAPGRPNSRREAARYVYVVQGIDGGPIKIGRTRDVASRVSSLQTACPFELRVLHFIEHENAAFLESALHQRFAAARLHGEWFDPEEPAVAEWLADFSSWPTPSVRDSASDRPTARQIIRQLRDESDRLGKMLDEAWRGNNNLRQQIAELKFEIYGWRREFGEERDRRAGMALDAALDLDIELNRQTEPAR